MKHQLLPLSRNNAIANSLKKVIRGSGRRLGEDEAGTTAIEYTLIATIIATMLVTSLGTISSLMKEDLTEVKTSIDNAKP
ncbi:Flp family type IVb pilin [Aquisalinus flavus]|uniref:Flp family type IVb pilin n=1 Tax=Aquisalinus flavus TaxID=1526572 RepID=A0A8J2Y3H1_9PROT|nr:Flp family type IVb pilin [Aquisalinus flavus]GGD04604.1 hypothetical protein GCM10011342_11960 [Aquisalinus flavus]